MPSTSVTFGMSQDAFGRLVLIDQTGQRHVGVEVVRAFPLSDTTGWISIVDTRGKELLLLQSFNDIPEPARPLLLKAIDRRSFMPAIERVLTVSSDNEPSEWTVETDHGPTSILLNGADDIRRLGPGAAILTDVHGVRYQIRDARLLDKTSRRLLERYLL